MIVSTLYLDKAQSVASGANFKFSFNIFNGVKNATAVNLLNNGNVQSAPCIITKRDSGTMVITYSNTSYYISPSQPNKLLTSDPD